MLSYQHAFHAGNHADILKHYVLTYVLQSLNKKEKPYTFFDTHSGSGIYSLQDERIIKTGEAEKGITELLKCPDFPEQMREYINFVEKYHKKNQYPGSPEIERNFMRSQDTLILSELHPQEIQNLQNNMKNSTDFKETPFPAIQIHKRNGWELLNALTPPKTKRGAALIDPSYEETQDYLDAAKYINMVHKKWNTGIIMLWYPLLAHREQEINQMLESICKNAKKLNQNIEIKNLTLKVYQKKAPDLPRLYGSGMLVLNAPWQLDENAEQIIKFAQTHLYTDYK